MFLLNSVMKSLNFKYFLSNLMINPLSFIKPPQDLRLLDYKATRSQIEKVATAFSGRKYENSCVG